MAVKDGPEFRQVLHEIMGKGGEGFQLESALMSLQARSVSQSWAGFSLRDRDRASGQEVAPLVLVRDRGGKRPGPEPWVRCPTQQSLLCHPQPENSGW